jgi:hypothetical protein
MSPLHVSISWDERAVFLVLARQKLLVGVFLNLRFFSFDVEFEPFAVGLDLFDAGFGGFELRLGGRGFGAEVSRSGPMKASSC